MLNTPEKIAGALLHVYKHQTVNEKNARGTVEQNSVGFNAFDANFLSQIAERVLAGHPVSCKQLTAVRRAIVKYERQYLGGFLEHPVTVYDPDKKKVPTARRDTNKIIMDFDYDEEIVNKVKSLPWRRFDTSTKTWSVPFEQKSLDRVKALGIFALDTSLKDSKTEMPTGVPNKMVSIGTDGLAYIHFDFDQNLISKIREIPGGPKWDVKKRVWTINPIPEAFEALKSLGFQVPDLGIVSSSAIPKGALPKKMDEVLFGYQKIGYEFIEEHGGRALIADEQGTGKTIQSLAYLAAHPELRPAVVVCPSVAKYNWRNELRMWVGEEAVVISGKKPNPKNINPSAVHVINYDILGSVKKDENGRFISASGWIEEFHKVGVKAVVADECHYFKNYKAQRTEAVKYLSREVDCFIALTGTPITNRPIEIYNALSILRPELFPSQYKFGMRYCDGHHDGYGMNFSGHSHERELHDILTKHVMLRRLKKDVLKDLPPKIRTVVPLDIDPTSRKQYKKEYVKFVDSLDGGWGSNTTHHLAQLEKLKQITIAGKMKGCLEWIDNVLDSGEKLIVFATHKATIDILTKRYGPLCVRVDGRDSAEARQKAVDSFQEDDSVRLFVGNIKAAGTAITLTAASIVAFLELDWVPANHDQAEARPHRIGTKVCVNVYYLLARNTIEEDIALLLDQKMKVISQIIDGKKVSTDSLLVELLNGLSRKEGV